MLKSGLLVDVKTELEVEDRPRPFLEPGLEDMLDERKQKLHGQTSKLVKLACQQ